MSGHRSHNGRKDNARVDVASRDLFYSRLKNWHSLRNFIAPDSFSTTDLYCFGFHISLKKVKYKERVQTKLF